MTKIWISYVGFLLGLGGAGYFLTGRQSFTALIPSFFAVIVAGVGLATWQWGKLSTQSWSLMILASLGFVATARALPGFIKMLSGEAVARPAAIYSQTLMALASLVVLVVAWLLIRRN